MRLLRADLGRVRAWGGARGVERDLVAEGETLTKGFVVEAEVCFGVVGFAGGMEALGVDSRLEVVLERDDLVVLVAFGLSF